jgi:hypothetical protein
MAKLWRRSLEQGHTHRAAEIDLTGFRISRPTIIFLSGIFTTDKKPEYVLEGIAEVENILLHAPPLKTPPDVIALSHSNLRNIFNVVAYNARPDRAFNPAAAKMAAAIILPQVLDANGRPVPPEVAARNLRNITLVGYSAGTVFGQELFNASLHAMKKAGYTEPAARDVLQEVVLISMATVSRPLQEHGRFTTLYLAATNDLAVRLKERILNPLRRLFRACADELVIRPLSHTSLLITAAVNKKMWHWQKLPNGEQQKKDISPLLPQWMRMTSHHEMPHYTTADDEHSAFSKIVLHGLVNAVTRDARTNVRQLLAPPNDAPDTPETHHYKNRISGAFLRAA